MADNPSSKPKSKRKLPSWAWYAGAGVAIGGAYFLYKKKSSAASSAAPTMTQPTTNVDTSAQQPSVVPYYLTANQGNSGYGAGTLTGGPPLPAPQGSTGVPNTATADQSSAVLPPIPPILPTNPVAPVAPAPAPAPSAPAPSAPAQNNNIPAALLQQITANGEKIIGGLPSPNGGMWWLGSKGGVFAINAPFYGAPAGQSYWGNRTAVSILPSGNGYKVIDTTGSTYNYPG